MDTVFRRIFKMFHQLLYKKQDGWILLGIGPQEESPDSSIDSIWQPNCAWIQPQRMEEASKITRDTLRGDIEWQKLECTHELSPAG